MKQWLSIPPILRTLSPVSFDMFPWKDAYDFDCYIMNFIGIADIVYSIPAPPGTWRNIQLCILSFLNYRTITVFNQANEAGQLHLWTEWVVLNDQRLLHVKHFGGDDWVEQLRTYRGRTLQEWIDASIRSCEDSNPQEFENATLQAIERCGVPLTYPVNSVQ